MNAYRNGWLLLAATLTLAGMLAAAALSLINLLVVFTGFAVVGAVVVLLVRPTDGPRIRWRGARDTLLGACVAGSSAGAFVGWTQILGAAALLLVLVVAVASPWAIGAIRRWLRTVPSRSEGQLDSVVRALASASPGFVAFQQVPQVQPATDEQLCQAWCASYRTLNATTSRRKFLRIVDERGGYLDELERRNPAAFAAWLASGATAADDPWPHLSQTHLDRQGINWDELIGGDWS